MINPTRDLRLALGLSLNQVLSYDNNHFYSYIDLSELGLTRDSSLAPDRLPSQVLKI